MYPGNKVTGQTVSLCKWVALITPSTAPLAKNVTFPYSKFGDTEVWGIGLEITQAPDCVSLYTLWQLLTSV